MSGEIYKHFALLGFAIFWATTAFMLKKWERSRNMSLSRHAASQPITTFLFGAAIILSLALYLLFIFKWFEPTFQLGKPFVIFNIAIAAGYIIGALIPDTSGLSHRIHHNVAYGAAWLMLLPMAILANSRAIELPIRVFAFAGLITMLVLWVRFITVKSTREKHLIYQVVYLLIFDFTILLTTYFS